eukprot:490192-Amorphochlora_amoeboformis.AAC.1
MLDRVRGVTVILLRSLLQRIHRVFILSTSAKGVIRPAEGDEEGEASGNILEELLKQGQG